MRRIGGTTFRRYKKVMVNSYAKEKKYENSINNRWQ